MNDIIETHRLILRPITMDDAADVFEYSCNPNVGPNAGWKPHESLHESKEVMKQIFIGKENIFGIVLKESGKLIGSIGFMNDPKRENPGAKMLGYAMGEPYWGRGLMSEAAASLCRWGFEHLNIAMISAYTFPFNRRSQRVLRKLGFRYEGTLSHAELLYDGRLLDNDCYVVEPSYFNDKTIYESPIS